jgi:hypothetical protein
MVACGVVPSHPWMIYETGHLTGIGIRVLRGRGGEARKVLGSCPKGMSSLGICSFGEGEIIVL